MCMGEEPANGIHNVRIAKSTRSIPAAVLKERYSLHRTPRLEHLGGVAYDTVIQARRQIESILRGEDERFIVFIGQCSTRDPQESLEIAQNLAEWQEEVKDHILIVKREYGLKPRTEDGWQGFVSDPNMDGTNDRNKGIELFYSLLVQINALGVPVISELVDARLANLFGDALAAIAVGARDVTGMTHRQMASGMSMPVGFKNTCEGSIDAAVTAVSYASKPGFFPGPDDYGSDCYHETLGNPYGFVILRGSDTRSNYDAQTIADTTAKLLSKGLHDTIVVDASHGNSRKDYVRQPEAWEAVLRQRVLGNKDIVGIMAEMNIYEASIEIPKDLTGFDAKTLPFGVSVTDSCMSLQMGKDLVFRTYEALSKHHD